MKKYKFTAYLFSMFQWVPLVACLVDRSHLKLHTHSEWSPDFSMISNVFSKFTQEEGKWQQLLFSKNRNDNFCEFLRKVWLTFCSMANLINQQQLNFMHEFVIALFTTLTLAKRRSAYFYIIFVLRCIAGFVITSCLVSTNWVLTTQFTMDALG